jgi:uroporphyrinogen decarboxylase
MTSRQRVRLVLDHEEPDRVPIHDTPWERTVARWHREGLPADQSPHSYFGYELAYQGPDISLQFPEEVLEEGDGWRIARSPLGAVQKTFTDHESIPQMLEFAINSPEQWEQHKHRLAWNDSRVDWDGALAANRSLRQGELFVCYFAHIGYDWLQRIIGAETMLMALAQDRAWVREMMDTLMDLVLRGLDEMLARGFEFDGAFVANDLGYRNGTFFSPAVFREVEFPAQQRMYATCRDHDLPVILHSCGNVREFVPLLIEAGLTCLNPLESKAGMDVVGLKREFGDWLAFMGGIDVRAMADPDPSAIEREIARKVPVAKQDGGYIYHSDHSIPDNVSWQQYLRVIDLVREYGGY